MCLNCWKKNGRPYDASPRAVAMADRFREQDGFGPLHIVVEDWNLGDEHIRFCLEEAGASADDVDFLKAFRMLTMPERWAAAILSLYPNFDPGRVQQHH